MLRQNSCSQEAEDQVRGVTETAVKFSVCWKRVSAMKKKGGMNKSIRPQKQNLRFVI